MQPDGLADAGRASIIGTPDYMSPEQAAGRALDFRSDQFSAGLVFYEMLTRRRLFHRATPVQTLSAIIQEEPLPLEGLDSRVPPPLRWAIERCLAKDPDERYALDGGARARAEADPGQARRLPAAPATASPAAWMRRARRPAAPPRAVQRPRAGAPPDDS